MCSYSVILISHNHEKFIESAVNSLISQTLKPTLLLIIDLLSLDDSRKIAMDFASRFPDIIEFSALDSLLSVTEILQQNIGKIKTPFFSFLSADDYCDSTRFEIQVKALEEAGPKVALCLTDAKFVGEDDQWVPGNGVTTVRGSNQLIPPGTARQRLVERNWIIAPSVVLRTGIAKRAIYSLDASMPFEDYPLWLELSRSFDFLYIPAELVYYRWHLNNFSAKPSSRIRFTEAQIVLLERVLETDPHLSRRILVRSYSLFGMAVKSFQIVAMIQSIRLAFKASLQIGRPG